MACKAKVSPGSESGAGLGTFLVRSPERNDEAPDGCKIPMVTDRFYVLHK